ncbi:MAG: dimethylsulfoniopropionate demethylase [Rhodobacteraceae bacterium]|nr:dimethylsulfoniopropionate demethylase [Paracoccaceae bacterium]
MAGIVPSRRVRGTPFSPGVQAAGAKAYTVYNHMLLPSYFDSYQNDYHHLKKYVQVWDVSVERQVSVKGPDAAKLMRMVSPRDMNKMAEDQCYYMPICDDNGGMLNDPVTIKLAEDHYWLSIADGDLLQFLLGLAIGKNLQVEIEEPDVSPLAIQGPLAEDLTAKIFGDTVRDIKFFRYKKLKFLDTQFVVARSGWSKQGGFEIYVDGFDYGMPLWNAFFEAGKDLNVRAGCPNLIERIEGGLLSFGSDMTRQNTPVEAGLAKFCNSPDEYLGKEIIEKQKKEGPDRIIRPVSISGDGDLPHNANGWKVLSSGKQVGLIASATWSPDFKTNVSIGMIEKSHWTEGTEVEVDTGSSVRKAEVLEKFWI